MAFTIPNEQDAAWPPQSQIFETDLAILAAGYATYRVLTGCQVTAQGSPDMSVHVAVGTITPGDGSVVAVTAGDLSVDAAHATLWRLDLVSVESDGTKSYTAGTAAATEDLKPPSLPAGDVALAIITVPPTAASIATDQIVDKRVMSDILEPAPVAHGSMGSADTFDYSLGPDHEGEYDAALTVTLTGWRPGRCILELGFTTDGTGGYGPPTFGAEVVNAADLAAVWDDAAGAYNLIVLRTVDEGTTVYIVNLPEPAAAITYGEDADITTQDYDDVADAGALDKVARADHLHGMPSASEGGSGATFKRVVRLGAGNLTTGSTTKTPLDATNLPYQTFTLATGDVVRCTLSGSVRLAAASGFDFEVDQPTSGNVYVAAGADYGCLTSSITTSRVPITVIGMFTATEAGSHGFRPVWLTDSGTATFCNAASGNDDCAITFIVEKLGAPTA